MIFILHDGRSLRGGRVVAITDPTNEQLSTLVAEDIPAPGEGPRHGEQA